MTLTIPLFPLKSVLFPGGVLPLRVFEPRYLDMISDCLRTDRGIGVVLIKNGSETGKAAEIYDMGTVCRINYWHKRKDGILGVTLAGEQRYKIVSKQVERNQLIIAEVELLENTPHQPVEERHQPLVDLLSQIMAQLDMPYTKLPTDYSDANWVSARLVELLPIELKDKQTLFNIEDAYQRLDEIETILRKLDIWAD